MGEISFIIQNVTAVSLSINAMAVENNSELLLPLVVTFQAVNTTNITRKSSVRVRQRASNSNKEQEDFKEEKVKEFWPSFIDLSSRL